jgi:putative DNA primase/helicase
LFISSPEKGCGKSTLLDVLSRLVPKPLGASGITAAALFRVIEAARPTLLLDEADTYLRDHEDLRGVLDAGHRRDGAVIRTVGEDHEPRQFSAWAPVALAAIGRVPGTIEDRSIEIGLRRRRADELVEPLRLHRSDGPEKLARMAARWAADHATKLVAADPAMPAGIINRTADNWHPLLAVANLAFGAWPGRAYKAALELSVDGEDTMSAGVLLLADLRELFDRDRTGVLFTREILVALRGDETRPWVEWKNGKPITERQLATLLKPYGIKPKTVRRGVETDKGYRQNWFEGAFDSYLPSQSVTASQPPEVLEFLATRSVTPGVSAVGVATDRTGPTTPKSLGCDVVTNRKPIFRADGSSDIPAGEETIL